MYLQSSNEEDREMITASSQRHRDDAIVQAKRDAKDYTVCVTPEFECGGVRMRVIVDGHHSLEAARLDGVDPEYVEQDVTDNDHVELINRGEFEDFFAVTRIDSDLYDIDTGIDIW